MKVPLMKVLLIVSHVFAPLLVAPCARTPEVLGRLKGCLKRYITIRVSYGRSTFQLQKAKQASVRASA